MSIPAFVYSPAYEADIGEHVFPTYKYRLIKETLEAQGTPAAAFMEPAPRPREILGLAHTAGYLRDLFGLRRTAATLYSELPLTQEIAEWFEIACYGSVTATELALQRGGAMHVGGGFHHAFADHAEGFCYLNDTAVAARVALGESGTPLVDAADRSVALISVVDLDVHQGNGTARNFQDDPRVFTFSMHQENNYPVKERGDLDIGLPDGADDTLYLRELDRGLAESVDALRPELVFYVAGADPYREDLLGGLALTQEGMRERDRRVFASCRKIGASVVVLLAGGYARNPQDTVLLHRQTAEELLAVWPWS